MNLVFALAIIFGLVCCELCSADRILSRKRRYLVFPEGASFSCAMCMTAQMGITDGAQIFTEGINWAIGYSLPNDTAPFKEIFEKSSVVKRRHRRDLYGKIETVMNSMGYDGRSCMLRALCEASAKFFPKESSLFHHILGIIFRFPQEKVLPNEPDEHRVYHWASQKGEETEEDSCYQIFNCPFSLIDLALGYYSQSNHMA